SHLLPAGITGTSGASGSLIGSERATRYKGSRRWTAGSSAGAVRGGHRRRGAAASAPVQAAASALGGARPGSATGAVTKAGIGDVSAPSGARRQLAEGRSRRGRATAGGNAGHTGEGFL